MKSCAVKSCRNHTNRNQKQSEMKLHFHYFPRDPVIRAAWAQICGLQGNMKLSTKTVCSDHFLLEDYDPSYLVKRTLISNAQAVLRHGTVPSQRLGVFSSCKERAKPSRQRQQQEQEVEQTADGAADDAEDAQQRRRSTLEGRRERQERRDRKELVERLLAEHEQREQAAMEEARLEAEKALTKSGGVRKRAAAGRSGVAGRPRGSVARAVAAAASGMAGDTLDGPAPTQDPASDDTLSATEPDDRAPSPASLGGNSDPGEVSRSPAGAAGGSKLRAILTSRPGKRVKVQWQWLKKSSPVGPAHPAHREAFRRHYRSLERTKEILQLRQKVRRLEAKCLKLLGGPISSQEGADTGVDKPAAGEQQTAGEGERPAGSEDVPPTGETAASAARDLREEPLVILRNDRASRVPSFVRHMRSSQLSDGMAAAMPSDLQEALEANHRLKVQFLNLQAVMLKWAITNKKLHSAPPKDVEEEVEESVRGPRLRELLRLEAAVKAMFTEAQLRAIVREHDDVSEGDAADKHRKQQWGEEDLRRMLELRAISSDKVLHHVREKMKIPLPTLRTVKLRCKKSPKLAEAYKEMLQKREKSKNICDMCKRQVKTIDEVIGDAEKLPDLSEDSPDQVRFQSLRRTKSGANQVNTFARHLGQRASHPSQDAADAKPKKRRRAAGSATTTSQQKKKRQGAASLDWETSDSDAELSDPGLWSRAQSSRVSWQQEMPADGDPRERSPLSPMPAFGYGLVHRTWQ